jgi:hypothetical protein
MHAQRGEWHFTALFSNTARAHQLGRTRDWVVIYYYDHDHLESQCTVVTETAGPLKGLRVIRGRELECARHYGPGLPRADAVAQALPAKTPPELRTSDASLAQLEPSVST